MAIPASRISSLSSGEFVGIVADNPEQKIDLKAFCAEIVIDHEKVAEEKNRFKKLPPILNVDNQNVLEQYLQVKKDISLIVQQELVRMMDTPELNNLIVRK
jgi:hypothetical protein